MSTLSINLPDFDFVEGYLKDPYFTNIYQLLITIKVKEPKVRNYEIKEKHLYLKTDNCLIISNNKELCISLLQKAYDIVTAGYLEIDKTYKCLVRHYF